MRNGEGAWPQTWVGEEGRPRELSLPGGPSAPRRIADLGKQVSATGNVKWTLLRSAEETDKPHGGTRVGCPHRHQHSLGELLGDLEMPRTSKCPEADATPADI